MGLVALGRWVFGRWVLRRWILGRWVFGSRYSGDGSSRAELVIHYSDRGAELYNSRIVSQSEFRRFFLGVGCLGVGSLGRWVFGVGSLGVGCLGRNNAPARRLGQNP